MKRKIYLFCLFFVLLFCLQTTCVLAEDQATRVDCEQVPMDGEWHDYQLQVDTYAYCPISMERNGRLTVNVQTYYDNSHNVYLLDGDYETVDHSTVHGTGSAKPENVTFDYFLTKGVYYVRVESWNKVSGLFRIKASYQYALTDEIESNDTFAEAMGISVGTKVRGFLSTRGTAAFYSDPLPNGSQDFQDYYSVTLAAGNYDVYTTPLESVDTSFYVAVYDSNRTKVWESYLNYSEQMKETRYLTGGIYYILVEASGRASGQYEIQVQPTPEPETEQKEPATEKPAEEIPSQTEPPKSETGTSCAHVWTNWQVVRKATVFSMGQKQRFCRKCGKTESVLVAKEKKVIKLSHNKITLKRKKSAKLKVTKYGTGDYVKAWQVGNKKLISVRKSGEYGVKIKAKKRKGKTWIRVKMASGITKKITVKIK